MCLYSTRLYKRPFVPRGANGLLFLALLLGLVTACQTQTTPYEQLEGQAQGTTFRILYQDGQRRNFATAVDSLFRLMDKSMSLWDSTSTLSRWNQNDTDTPLDAHFLTVYKRAVEVSSDTEGYFDCTVGPLVKAWGFSTKKGLPPPDSARVRQLLSQVGYQRLRLTQDARLLKPQPDTELDFNAIAQGYTVDVIADFLEARGIQHYLVEVGGEVRAKGTNARKEPWRVGIDKPTEGDEARSLQTVVSLSGKSLATSGSYRKFLEREGKKYSHAIDPHTGFPVTHQLLSISVIAGDCMTADAYATAFLVMGLEKARPIAERNNLALFAIMAAPDGSLTTFQSPSFPVWAEK